MPGFIKDGLEEGLVSFTTKFRKEKRGPREQTPTGHTGKGCLEAVLINLIY